MLHYPELTKPRYTNLCGKWLDFKAHKELFELQLVVLSRKNLATFRPQHLSFACNCPDLRLNTFFPCSLFWLKPVPTVKKIVAWLKQLFCSMVLKDYFNYCVLRPQIMLCITDRRKGIFCSTLTIPLSVLKIVNFYITLGLQVVDQKGPLGCCLRYCWVNTLRPKFVPVHGPWLTSFV